MFRRFHARSLDSGPFQGAKFSVAAGEPSFGPDGQAVARSRTLLTRDGEHLPVTDLDLFHTRVRCDKG